jgi:hypothetical protein
MTWGDERRMWMTAVTVAIALTAEKKSISEERSRESA